MAARRKRLIRKTSRVKGKSRDLKAGVAWYKPEQWELLKKVSQDRDELENTYMEWLEFAQEKLEELENMGMALEKVEVDVEDLVKWCKKRNLMVNGESRAAFVSYKQKNQETKK
ncbi:MAG: hypothetical protein GTO45_08540 [Candidatus Aminicenantes bacterium]|nr:hypothetical protein [Candidatus Aminicenantes bacterium]NIM78879.1 hypothetical protein [Candidatus Aminicenantes bacterium]NIN18135.1 hypothetical protein [Candidatus Aminicenantes bacterium]NIN42034.1 hypothetical protein [Candidatus Aminicenantes bacterium]NIN84790.1 hypothetical protein [Candidatus Aminicenantes bacterium]